MSNSMVIEMSYNLSGSEFWVLLCDADIEDKPA